MEETYKDEYEKEIEKVLNLFGIKHSSEEYCIDVFRVYDELTLVYGYETVYTINCETKSFNNTNFDKCYNIDEIPTNVNSQIVTSLEIPSYTNNDNEIYTRGGYNLPESYYFKKNNLIAFPYNFGIIDSIKPRDNKYFMAVLSLLENYLRDMNPRLSPIKDKHKELTAQMRQGRTKLIMDYEHDIKNLDVEAKNMLSQYYKKSGDLRTKKEKLKALKDNFNMDYEKLLNDLEDIKRFEYVNNTEIRDGMIVVVFNPIEMSYDGDYYEMGGFDVIIGGNSIEIENHKRIYYSGEEYHSPHIENGHICFGGDKTPYELLEKLEIKKLILYIKMFLSTVNNESTYVSEDYFYRAYKYDNYNFDEGDDYDD